MFVNSKEPASVVTATEPLKQLLIDSLATKGYEVANVTIEVTGTYEAAGEALSSGTAQLAFIPGSTYVLYHEDGAELLLVSTRDGLNKDSENAKDWNDGQATLPVEEQVSFYRSLILAGPTETGKALAAKVNAGEALTWADVDGANWCFSNSVSSSAGYLFPTVWLRDNFDGKKLTDLWLDLAKVQLRLRECEELAAKMPKRYRGVVKSRYFDGSKKHPPEWGSSAAEFGFPFGGEELRRRVTKCLNEICN